MATDKNQFQLLHGVPEEIAQGVTHYIVRLKTGQRVQCGHLLSLVDDGMICAVNGTVIDIDGETVVQDETQGNVLIYCENVALIQACSDKPVDESKIPRQDSIEGTLYDLDQTQ